MSIDDATPTPTYQDSESEPAAEPIELTEAQKEAKGEATTMRMENVARASVLDHLLNADIDEEIANEAIDTIDELIAIMHNVRPADVSEAAGVRIDALNLEDPLPAIPKLTRKAEDLVNDATKMAARSESKQSIVQHLTKHGVTKAEATKLASQVSMQMSAARAKFNESRDKARRDAYFKIGIGVLMIIVGLALMGSGAESGRRSPVGVLIAGFVTIGSGINTMSKVDEQSFAKRVNEVYR